MLQSFATDMGRALGEKIELRSAVVGVIGQGYVGLPLSIACCDARFRVIGFDVDSARVERLNRGESHIDSVTPGHLGRYLDNSRFSASDDLSTYSQCDVLIICVPTPLTKHREPDLRYVEATTRAIAATLRRGMLVVLESTTYPGTTDEVVKPRLEESGLVSGLDFFIGFSPEREDPGNSQFNTATIPKIVAGDGIEAQLLVAKFYAAVVESVVPVSSLRVAEAVKITENIFRAVNIALVNELKVIYDTMGIDVWEVISGASTKPFGFMPFYPGPGLGGHCIPIDPFYLAWKAREYGLTSRFIELSGEINIAMPAHVIAKLALELDRRRSLALGSSRILIIGLAYKRDISDIRESPSLELMDILARRGATVDYHDPHVAEVPVTRKYPHLAGTASVPLTASNIQGYDAAIVATDHSAVDYSILALNVGLVLDTRNVFARNKLFFDNIIKA